MPDHFVRSELVPPLPPVDPARVESTVKILLTGVREYDVLQAVRELWPDQEIGPLIVACVESLSRSAEVSPDVVRGWAIEATKAVYRKCIDAGEFPAALRAVRQIYDLSRE